MKGILIVSFGTSYKETREKNIDAIQTEVEKLGFSTYCAFTSGMIIKKLAKQGEIIHNVETALKQMQADNIKEVAILPTHLLYGFEYEKILVSVEKYKNMFDSIKIATPLLGNNEDMVELINILAEELPQNLNQAVVLMGHGTEHFSNVVYPGLDYIAKQQNYPHLFVTTVEGYPDIDVVIELLKNTNYTDVLLTPLMLVAGDHAVNDMASDEPDSLKTILINNGYNVETLVKGLGEYAKIRDMYIKHLKEIL